MVADTTRLNSSEPTPRMRVSYAPRRTRMSIHATTMITTNETYVGSLISTEYGIAHRRMKPVMPAVTTTSRSSRKARVA